MSFLLYLLSLPYMRWHIFFVLIPSAIMWLFYGRYLVNYKKTLFFVTIGSFLWGFSFNLVASPLLHIWNYGSPTLGVWFFGLPIEEFLFISLVPQELASFFLIFRKKDYAR